MRHIAPIGAGKSSGVNITPAPLPAFDESGLHRDSCSGVEDEAVACQTKHRRQRQPRSQDRPKPHRDRDAVALDEPALDTDCSPLALRDPPKALFCSYSV